MSTKWFRHSYDASDEGAVERISARYGNAGVGIYWRVVEKMHRGGGKLHEEIVSKFAKQLQCDEDVLQSILTDFDLFEKGEKEFFASWIVSNVKEADRLSRVRKKAVKSRWEQAKKGDTKAIQTEYKADTSVDTNVIQTAYKTDTSADTKPIQSGYKTDTELELELDNTSTTSGEVVLSATADAVAVSALNPALDFEAVWEKYQRKGHKKVAAVRWKNLSARQKQQAADYIAAYVAATPEKRYRLNFEVFINLEAWNDELPVYEPVKSKSDGKTLDDFARRAARVAATASALLAGEAA